jgi:hypothetical protein
MISNKHFVIRVQGHHHLRVELSPYHTLIDLQEAMNSLLRLAEKQGIGWVRFEVVEVGSSET